MKKVYLLLIFSFIYTYSKAQLYYNFNSLNGSPSSGVPAGFTASNITANNTNRTSDFFTTTSASNIYPGFSGGGNITIAAKGGSASTNINSLSYFELTITPSPTEKVRISSISFGSRSISSSGGPTGYVIRSSVDNYAANVAASNINANAVWTLYNNSFSQQIIGATGISVTIRIYANNGSGASGTTNNWRIDDLTIGFVSRPTISNFLMGQNAWLLQGFYAGSNRYGQLNSLWPLIKASGVKMVRVGGIALENNSLTASQAIDLIDSIRKIGAEPMVQVATGRSTFTAAQAASLVEQVNIVNGKNVKYWIIGNEPDLDEPTVNVSGVETYIKSYASAMKAKDPSILIVGPECAYYNSNYYPALVGGANDITGKDANGNYYVDVLSFHTYPFDSTQTRAQVVTSAQNLANNVDNLLALINNANSLNNRTGVNKLRWALTEFNVNFRNPASRTPSNNNVTGVGVHSFLNGQYWADVFNVGMTKGALSIMPWSVHEGGGGRGLYDLGYLDGSGSAIKPRSSYYHEQMISNYIKGTYLYASNNQAEVTSFGSFYNDTTSIMIVNKALTNFNYSLQLNDKTITDGSVLKINLLGDIDKLYTDQIDAQSTVVLLFNSSGNLIKKIVYSISNATASLPPTEIYTTLPLTWIDFQAKKQGTGSVYLSWVVSNQINTKSYYIEKLSPEGNFATIGSIPSVDDKSLIKYSFYDNAPSDGNNYYRIKQIDVDGKFTYSKVCQLNLSNLQQDWFVYPNPIVNATSKLFVNNDLTFLDYKLIDVNGKVILEKQLIDIKSGTNIILNHGVLNQGIYVLQVSTNNGSRVIKLIVE